MDKLLYIGQVAEIVNVQKTTIEQWVRNGWIPKPIKIGKKTIRWRESDIVKWIKNGCPKTRGE